MDNIDDPRVFASEERPKKESEITFQKSTNLLEQMTATDEQVEEAIKDYGTITDTRFIKEEPKQEINNTYIEKEPEVKNEPVTMVTETKVGAEKNEKKYIICPSCGEMIYLD